MSRSCLVCHLRSTTPQEAIDKLFRAGVIAVEGPEPASITLVGYHVEIRTLLRDFRIYGRPHERHSSRLMGKLHRLSLMP